MMTAKSRYWLLIGLMELCSICYAPAQTMQYTSTMATPLEAGGFAGEQVFPVELVEIKTTGSYSPLTLLQLNLQVAGKENYAGTTIIVYYTGSKDSFGTAVPFAKKKLQKNVFSVSGLQQLQSGSNFFWITIERSKRDERVLPDIDFLSCTTGRQQYGTVWADEFNTDGLPDTANWSYERGFVRNDEEQWYQEQNAFCKNGLLTIEARRDSFSNPRYEEGSRDWRRNRKTIRYTSASINTRGRQQWLYGRWEMRARLDTNAGCWPAWWALGSEGGDWPNNGEIDMMEFYRGKILANYAVGTQKQWNAKWYSTDTPLNDFNKKNWTDSFHLWRMDWDSAGIAIYLDDKLLNYQPQENLYNRNGNQNYFPFRHPQYMLLNFALGGQNGGDPSGTVFPRQYDIDFVRVLQKQEGKFSQIQIHQRYQIKKIRNG